MLDSLYILSVIVNLLAIAGGGGSSGGGGGGGGGFSGGSSSSHSSSGGSSDPVTSWISLIISVVIIGGVFIAAFIIGRKAIRIQKQKRLEMQAALAAAASVDKVWEPDTLVTHAKDTFLNYQKDWSSFNLESMKKYMTPEYYQHSSLMMAALKLANRKNEVQEPKVLDAVVLEFNDAADNSKDTHTVELSVYVHDVLIDTGSNSQLFAQNLAAVEYYMFERSGDEWLFDGINQATANPALRNTSLETFAKQNAYFYSLDWGHLLLPSRGQLFSSGNFGVSDINNHVIGLLDEILIQIYNYVPNPAQPLKNYVIAQAALPKSYGNIVVRRKQGIFGGSVGGLRKMKMEWQDFNDNYEVFASDQELATSFELLNPKFMEQLYAVPFVVNIEVVDNIVYLYAPQAGAVSESQYQTMLEILKAAFKEMRQ